MKAIICNGGYRTGSTAVFNVILNIVSESGVLGPDYRSVGADHKQTTSFVDLHPIFLTTRYVIKSHDYHPEVVSDDIKLIYTHRNPLASAASSKIAIPHKNDDMIYQDCIKNYANFLKYKKNSKVLTILYEDITNNLKKVVKDISKYLGVDLSNETCSKIYNKCEIENVEKICKSLTVAADPYTQYRKNHISKHKGSDNYWGQTLSPELIQKIKKGIKDEDNKS